MQKSKLKIVRGDLILCNETTVSQMRRLGNYEVEYKARIPFSLCRMDTKKQTTQYHATPSVPNSYSNRRR